MQIILFLLLLINNLLINSLLFNPLNIKCDMVDIEDKINNAINTQHMENMHDNIFENVPHKMRMFIFKKLTTDLPDFHKQGDDLLHMNDNMITFILNSNIDINLKKELITKIIDFTLWGDHMGSNILHIYKVLIENLTF